jgi:hypothetical protein
MQLRLHAQFCLTRATLFLLRISVFSRLTDVVRLKNAPSTFVLPSRGQKARMIESQAYDANSSNPFSDRPSTARQREEALRALDAAMEELDKSMPENMDPAVWDRLCRYRREKVDLEHEVRKSFSEENFFCTVLSRSFHVRELK